MIVYGRTRIAYRARLASIFYVSLIFLFYIIFYSYSNLIVLFLLIFYSYFPFKVNHFKINFLNLYNMFCPTSYLFPLNSDWFSSHLCNYLFALSLARGQY